MGLGAVLREFGVKLTLDFDKKKVEEAKRNVAEVGAAMRSVGLEIAAAATTLFGFAAVTSHNSRELQQNAAMLGINVERLQELEYAAKVAAGATRGDLMGALESISGTLDRARHSDVMAAQSLRALGLPMDMIMNKSVTADQVLLQLGDSFARIQDPMAKMRLATDVGGAGLAKMLPLLNKGAMGMAMMGKEGRDLGVILGKKTIDQGAEFDRTLTRIWFVLKNITYLIGNSLIKYLTPTVLAFQKWVVANRQFMASGIAAAVKALGTYLAIVFKVAKLVAGALQGVVHSLGGVERVARLVGLALGVFTGLQIIGSIGKLAMSMRALAGVMGVISSESLLAGAGLIALVLIVQDWFSKDSTIKKWMNQFKEQFPNLSALAGDFVDNMVTGVNFMVEGWKELWEVLQPIRDFFSSNLITQGMNKAEEFAKYIRSGGIGDKVFDMVQYLKGGEKGVVPQAQKTVTPQAGFVGPRLPNGAERSGDANATMAKNEFNANLTVNVPAGTSAQAASDIVSNGSQKAFDAMMRQARDQSVGQRAY